MSSEHDQRGPSPELDAVIQKLEESLLHSDGSSGERSLTLQGDTQTPVPITTRIFQILTSNLADQPAVPGESFEVNSEESQAQTEQLSPIQMDRDQPLVHHTSLTETMLVLQSAVDSDQDSEPSGSDQSQSPEKTYSQKLQNYQEAQKKQVQFVQKLQTKVLQCQRRCGELEEQLLEKTSECEKMLQAHLDSAERQRRLEEDLNAVLQEQLSQLQEEQRRSTSLSQVNSVLREQLDQAGSVNKELTESLWKAHRDIELCDTHLRREQETRASRSSSQQAQVRALWRQAASLRTTFILLRTFTDRTLSDMRCECVAVSRQLRVTCKNFEVRAAEARSRGSVETSALETQLKDKLKEAMGLQALWDAEKIELTCRIEELTNTLQQVQSQTSEKDSILQTSLDRMETRRAEDKAELEILHADILALQNILYQIHQLVSSEGDSSVFSSPVRGQSPLRNTTFRAVQKMLSKHQDQSQDLNARLKAALEQVDTFQDQLQERDAARLKLEQRIQEVQRESQEAKKALEENLKDSNRDRCSLELISSEKGSLEELLSGLQQEVNSQRDELEVLRSSLLDLQRQRDLLRQQKEDLETQLAHQCTEVHRGERILQELDERHSKLCREHFTMKEALSRISLQKEMLEEDKAGLSLALTNMQAHSASQKRSLTKLLTQQAALKDSFTKMAALSEGLAKDKVELHRIVLQVESEKAALDERRREADAARAAAREDAAQTQKQMMNLLAEKQALESSCIQLRDMCQKLEAELCFLQKVNAEALEKNSQVRRQMQTLQEELCVCRKELEVKSSAVQKAACDREELAKDRAALDVRLHSADLKACGLMQELLALRAEKESLETALFESQELFVFLKAERSRLEGERSSLILANESLTRDAAQMQVEAEQQLKQAAEQRELEELDEVERKALVMLSTTEHRHRGELEVELWEKSGSLRQQLQETESNLIKRQRDLFEAHAQKQDKLRKEALDLKQLLGNETSDKEAIHVSNQELRAFTRRAESDNSSLKQALGENEQKLSILEECRFSINQELTMLRGRMRQQEKTHLQACRELRRQIKVTEGENSRQTQELLELQARVCQEEQKEEEARREAFALRQRLLECEAGKEAALNEVAVLQCCMRELETAERESQELLQEKEVCQQQSDQKHRETTAQLEAELRDSRTTVKELTVQIGLAENRTQNLKEELSLTRAKCMDLEHHLAGLYGALRSTVGLNRTKPSDNPGGRSMSAGSVMFLHHDEELDVNSLHTAIQEFQEELRDRQRERDEGKALIVKLSQDVSELRGSQEKTTTTMLELQTALKQSEEGKRQMAEQLQKADSSLSLQQDAAHRLERDNRHLHAEVAQLMTSLQDAWTESRTLQDKLDILRGLESCANAEQLRLKESLEAAESRVSCLELSQRTFEGELQRAQLRAAELDAEVGALQERLTDLRKKLSESEDRCAALQVSEQRLATSLSQSEQHENQLREQVHKLSNILSSNRVNIEGLQEQIAQLQRVLTTSEQDRRLLQDCLDKTRDTLSESKRLNHTLTEQTQNLQRAQEDSDLKLSELEKHCRTLKESLKQQQEAELKTSQQGQREKEEIQEKLNNLQSCLQELQGERADMEKVLTHLKRDKSALRKTLEKVELDRLRKKEEAAALVRGNALMEQTVCNLHQELTEKQEMLETLQVQMSQLEHSHAQNLLEVIARHHQELDLETERLRDSQLQAEQALETRERAHQQRVSCLEEQVLTLKEQLDQETRRRQAYFSQMLQPGV